MDDKKAVDLDSQTKVKLNEILHKDEADLSPSDREFLQARAYYLKDKHKARYPGVFNGSKAKDPKKDEQKKAVAEKKSGDKKESDESKTPPSSVTDPFNPAQGQDQDLDDDSDDEDLDDDDDGAEG